MAELRLDRILGNFGVASRSEARRLVRAGRVAVDGEVVRDPSRRADPARVTVDGGGIEAAGGLFVAFHKPVGYVCSHDDREGPRVWDLLPGTWLDRRPRPVTVGRLDRDTSGLLLVTDRTRLVHEIGSPGRHVPKRYRVRLDRPIEDAAGVVERLSSGRLVLRGEATPCAPAEVRVLGRDELEVVLTEGRHRQVRRMLAACGYTVVGLHRTAVGPYELGDLAPGAWRPEDPAALTAG